MKRMVLCGALTALVFAVAPAMAADNGQGQDLCYWCMRDAVYADASLIAHLEANPDVDEGEKGPQILDRHADIHRLRAVLGPAVDTGPEPCCYSRKPLVIR